MNNNKCAARVSLYTETGVYADRYKDRGCKNAATHGAYCKAHSKYNVPAMDRDAFEALRASLGL